MTPVNPMQQLNVSKLQAQLFTANAFQTSTSSNPFGIFGSQMNMPIAAPSFDFGNLFSGSFNFNFDFSNISLTSASSSSPAYTAKSGNRSAASGAKGLDAQFLARVKEIANKIGCDYKDLLGVMHSESGLNSTAVNKNGGATGLIQFMPKTAESLGTTTEALRNMSALEQLDYVEKFLINTKNSSALKNKSKLTAGDLYTLVFLPGYAGQEVVTQSGSKYYACNKGLDANKDGKITKTELGNRVISHHVNESVFA